jgi:hypothetical protein
MKKYERFCSTKYGSENPHLDRGTIVLCFKMYKYREAEVKCIVQRAVQFYRKGLMFERCRQLQISIGTEPEEMIEVTVFLGLGTTRGSSTTMREEA